MRQNIPPELRALKQWVVSGASKIPFNPRTGAVASPTDPNTWGSFEEAVNSGAPNIGFVLTADDPYCIIDLDDKPSKPATPEQKARHQQILAHFDSYTELSTSSTEDHKGYHIVVKGSIPSGVNRDGVEMYSSLRYIIMTGNVVKALPIADHYQPTLDAMYGQMKPEETVELMEVEEVTDDRDIVEMAMAASNADKFNALCAGEINDYPSQSEADLALLSIFAYYSRSDEQVRRLFRMSALGKREKAIKNDVYLNYALRKIRAKQPPPVDLDGVFANARALLAGTAPVVATPTPVDVIQPAPTPAPVPHETQQLDRLTLPPGLVGEIAQYVYASSQRPVPEIALATAIAFVAGVVGRSYNTSTRAGLSQYIALLAKTGTGKEAASSSISRLLTLARAKVPAATQYIGPSVFASGPALHRVLGERPCFVSVLGEFGLLLQKMSNRNANAADLTLLKTILDCYGKSGYGEMLHPSVYSDKEKNVGAVASPNVTILGESTPESFYDALDEGSITSGFLPRFFILEYEGERPTRNPNAGMPPSDELINRVAELVTIALTTESNNTCLPVMEDSYAKLTLDVFDEYCDNHMRGVGDVQANIWNRAHLKALKLAALIAVGVSPHQPVVTQDIAEWAVALVKRDSTRLAARFAKGNIGSGTTKQHSVMEEAIKWYFKTTHKDEKVEAAKQIGWVNHSALMRRLTPQSVFKNSKDPRGDLKKTFQDMIDNGQLVVIDPKTVQGRFGTTAVFYGVGNAGWQPE